MSNVIVEYTLQQAIKDGVLVEIFKSRWKELSGGKPIVATSHLFNEVSEAAPEAALIDIWNEYVDWRKNVMPTLPEKEQMFVTEMDGEKIWVIEDGQAYTLLYPDDY